MLIMFIFSSSYTLLNLLIGILCQVVVDVKKSEAEKYDHYHLKHSLIMIMDCYDRDGNGTIYKEEFRLLMNNPEVHEALTKFGTDARGLSTLVDVLFSEAEALGSD